MPLVEYTLHVVEDVLRRLDRDPSRLGNVLCLAHPDIVAARATVRDIFGERIDGVTNRKDTAATIRWHKAGGITQEILDTESFFKCLGYRMRALDITEGRGGEEIHDLSFPLPPDHSAVGDNDFVFDCISNQVFNVAQAWWTMIACCRLGGWVLSQTPVQMVNQGFWNVSPTAYYDFAEANGMQIESIQHIVGVYAERDRAALAPVIRCRGVPDDTMNVVLMRKVEHRDTPVWPIMTKFKKYPTCQIPPPGAAKP